MKRLITFVLVMVVACACNKDEFPDEFSIIGPWLEKTAEPAKAEIEFKSGNRVYKKLNNVESFDTLRYKLDKKDELLLFLPDEYPDGIRTSHKLSYSSRTEELIIYSLYPSTPESPSRTVFKRK